MASHSLHGLEFMYIYMDPTGINSRNQSQTLFTAIFKFIFILLFTSLNPKKVYVINLQLIQTFFGVNSTNDEERQVTKPTSSLQSCHSRTGF